MNVDPHATRCWRVTVEYLDQWIIYCFALLVGQVLPQPCKWCRLNLTSSCAYVQGISMCVNIQLPCWIFVWDSLPPIGHGGSTVELEIVEERLALQLACVAVVSLAFLGVATLSLTSMSPAEISKLSNYTSDISSTPSSRPRSSNADTFLICKICTI